MVTLSPRDAGGVAGQATAAPEGASGLGVMPEVPPSTPAAPRARVRQLDVLRAFAVLLVMCAHVYSCEWLQRCGWVGVDLFFVLSGFLVSGLLYNEYKKRASLAPGRFLLRRGLKIYPAFYFFVLASVALMAFKGMDVPADRLLAEALFVQNYYGGLWGHTWSVCVEEHFYLLLTGTLYLLWRRAGKGSSPFAAVPKLTLLVAAGALAARVVTHLLVVPFDFQTHFKPTHLRIDSLLFGVCLAYFHHFHHERFVRAVRRRAAPILVASLAALAPCVVYDADSVFMTTVGFTLLYLGFGGLLLLTLYCEVPWPAAARRSLEPAARLLAWVGGYSYSIYLWHLVVATLGLSVMRRAYAFVAASVTVGVLPPPHYLLEFALYVAASVVVGVLMAKLVEMPVLRLRDRYFPARS